METASFLSSLLKMVFSLAIVLGMMIGAMYFIKKLLHNATPAIDRGSMIKILANRYLGPKSSIMVVDVAGQIIVVGLSNQQMTVLTTISDKDQLVKLRNMQINEEISGIPIIQQFARCKEKITSAMDNFRK
ncbi:MAG: Flagellar biosynthesis protein, FliO [Syntrophus sp. PtaB.Bin001]|nr:MAG: Flagellar biosynthesis protein, FliO [Syntrophus sp. PtaB.Bin001]